MPTPSHVALFIVLLVSLCNTPTNANQHTSLDAAESIVRIQTELSAPIFYNCGVAGSFRGSSGSSSTITASLSANTECTVVRNGFHGIFLARDAKYDQGHIFIFWQVKSDGFYHSWDHKTWIKRANWNKSLKNNT